MSMIFPGMDPYLEHRRFWPAVHNRFIIYISDALQDVLPSRYVAGVNERVFFEIEDSPRHRIVPDVNITREPFPAPNEGGVAVIEEVETDAPMVVEAPELEVHESYVTIIDMNSDRKIVTIIELLSPSNKQPGAGRESYRDKQRDARKRRPPRRDRPSEDRPARFGRPLASGPRRLRRV